MSRATSFAAIAVVVLCSCASAPSDKALREAHYGDQLSGDYRGDIRGAFEGLLIDPDSAQYKYSEPEQGWGRSDKGFVYGWVVWTQVNSKNQFGAFTSWKSYKVLVREGKVHSIYEPAGNDLFGNARFKRLM